MQVKAKKKNYVNASITAISTTCRKSCILLRWRCGSVLVGACCLTKISAPYWVHWCTDTIGQGEMALSSRREGLDWMLGEVFYRESGEALERAAQRGCGCSIPRGVQGQVGWGPGKPGLVPDLEVGGPDWGRGVGTWWSLGSLPTQAILWLEAIQLLMHLNTKITHLAWQNFNLES